MSNPIPWPENSQTVCVIDTRDIAHRTIKCEQFYNPDLDLGEALLRPVTFTTTGLAAKKHKSPCLCLLEVLP